MMLRIKQLLEKKESNEQQPLLSDDELENRLQKKADSEKSSIEAARGQSDTPAIKKADNQGKTVIQPDPVIEEVTEVKAEVAAKKKTFSSSKSKTPRFEHFPYSDSIFSYAGFNTTSIPRTFPVIRGADSGFTLWNSAKKEEGVNKSEDKKMENTQSISCIFKSPN
ncbi:hypothetical protein AQULUS_18080 [Aquicella lusitana]|uniref:Uncharacterized protein n=2 Tax=Aquicella lusitana TaxID=254246 RepID=A0A370GY40_9COXI|nr:hypothetical protein C8D86_1025 [Aquicella lusitana]VVC74045.1 hypothetical protein AQULUS_18080 [Aquicella lusitana]